MNKYSGSDMDNKETVAYFVQKGEKVFANTKMSYER